MLAGLVGTAIEMAPGYIVTREQLDRTVEAAEQAIREVMRDKNLG